MYGRLQWSTLLTVENVNVGRNGQFSLSYVHQKCRLAHPRCKDGILEPIAGGHMTITQPVHTKFTTHRKQSHSYNNHLQSL